MSLFRAKTVDAVLKAVYTAIDDLEIVSEQNQLLFDQNDAKINELLEEQKKLTDEGERAENVAAKLRALIA